MWTRRIPPGSSCAQRFAAVVALLAMALAGGCGDGASEAAVDATAPSSEWRAKGEMVALRLPSGFEMRCELRLTPAEQAEGMMFRPPLPADVCMLFVFETMERRGFWMFNTLHPLDIVWLDDGKRIVEMVPNAAPCPSRDARQCPSYGGGVESVYVIEFGAGAIAAHGLEIGQQLEF